MKKKLLPLILLLLAGLSAAQAYDFSAVAPTGQTLFYTIDTVTNTTVSVVGFDNTQPMGNLTIPSTVTYGGITYSVTSIGYSAFFECTSLTSVSIPNSVTSIGPVAFSDCTSLTSISIPNSVTSIGGSTFWNCSGLTSISIPNSITSIEPYTFLGCTSLSSITIPDSVTTIGSGAFYDCTSLSSITIPDSVSTIGLRTFENCTSLSSVTIGHSVSSIGDRAFAGCVQLTSVTIPNSVTSLGNNAFFNCIRLSSVYLGSSIRQLPANLFLLCDSISIVHFDAKHCSDHNGVLSRMRQLSTLYLGNNVDTLPSDIFRNMPQIQTIYLDPDSNQITTIGANAFDGCNNMAGHIVVPHITSLGDGAFSGCGMISSVELGNGLSAIGDTVFKGCDHMTNVTLGRGVQSIADNAFEGCTEIRLLTSRALNPPTIYRTTFEDVDDDISVRVPCDAVAAYQNAPFWSHFNNIEGRFDFFFSATSADITKGSVTIVHAPVCDNIEAHIQANPYHGYRFSHWSDGNTDNPRYIVVTQDTIITAHFESTEGIDTPLLHPAHYSQEGNRIVVNGAEGQSVRVFDIMGKLISSQPNVPEPFSFYLPAAGVYLIQIGSRTPQKIVVH